MIEDNLKSYQYLIYAEQNSKFIVKINKILSFTLILD